MVILIGIFITTSSNLCFCINFCVSFQKINRADDAGILKFGSRGDLCWIYCGIKVAHGFGSSAEWSGRIGAKLLSGCCARARISLSLSHTLLFVLGRAGNE
jgi:hypothetical protein